jgi:hypothetical protein
MTRADFVLAAYLAMLGMIVAFEATAEVRKVVAAEFSAPAARQAGGVAAITPSSAEMVKFRAGLGAPYWR